MERYPWFKYKIGKIDENNFWIRINDVNDSGWEKDLFDNYDDGPVEFMLRIKDNTGWNIEETQNFGYKFTEDELKLIYRWDDLFGFTVGFDNSTLNKAVSFLEKYLS